MQQLKPLQTTDHSTCRFLFSDSLSDLWNDVISDDNKATRSETTVLVIVDANVWRLHRTKIEASFKGINVRYFVVPAGERSKSTSQWLEIIDYAFSEPLRRNTPVMAIGGGVTGDLSGFVAASIMRGLPFIQVPTTLLAMVDSAIGGKTGINHPFGKNTIGAFYHPLAVCFFPDFLETLPQREWLCGLSEVLKYGYIKDQTLLDKAVTLSRNTKRDRELLIDVIKKSVQIKSEVVESDARESGIRAYLNFGHTFAHALEAADGFEHINHGEAVYVGMIAAIFVSQKVGAPVSAEPLLALKKIYNLDLNAYTSRVDELVSLMRHDKKNRDESIRLVLLEEMEKPVLHSVKDVSLLKEAWLFALHQLKL